MNRRAFLTSLPFVPAAVKAVVLAPAAPASSMRWVVEWSDITVGHYKANAYSFNGVVGMLEEMPPLEASDLDEILAKIYRKRLSPT